MEEAIQCKDGRSILDCLEKYHDIKICERTLITKLQDYGLRRRTYNANEEQAIACIESELRDNGKLFGYSIFCLAIFHNSCIKIVRTRQPCSESLFMI